MKWLFQTRLFKILALVTFAFLMIVVMMVTAWKSVHHFWLSIGELATERQPVRIVMTNDFRRMDWSQVMRPTEAAASLMKTRGLPWFDPRLPPSYEPADFPYERSGLGDYWFEFGPRDPGSVLSASKFKWKRGLAITAADTKPMIAWHGTLHSHTGWSDGSATPADAYAFARDLGGLDFMAVTDHPEFWLFNPGRTWEQLREIAAMSDSRDFLAVRGFEYSNPIYGHYIVIGSNGVCSAVKCPGLQDFYDWLLRPENKDALVAFAHPMVQKDNATRLEFKQMSFFPPIQSKLFGVEVIHWSGYDRFQFGFSGKQPFIDEALASGWRAGSIGSQDNHGADWGLANSRIGVLMEELSHANLMDALRSRRFYATSSRDLQLSFDARIPGTPWTQMGGSINVRDNIHVIPRTEPGLETRLRIFEPDEFNVPRRVEWILDGYVAGRLDFDRLPHELAGSVANENYYAGEVTGRLPVTQVVDGRHHYIYARIYSGANFEALTQTSPIFIEP